MMSDLKFLIILISIFILVECHIGEAQTTASTTNGGFNDSDTFLFVDPCIYLYSSSIIATIYTKSTNGNSYNTTEYTLPGTFTTDTASSCYNNSAFN